MKKIRTMIVIICLIIINGLPVIAKENIDKENSQCMELDSLIGINLESQQAETERLEKIGEVASKKRATKVLSNFKNLQQGDSAWKNEIMQTCGRTIGNAGCCLTSFTMIQRYYGGTDNPKQVNAKLGSAACPFQYATAASKYSYTYNYVTNNLTLSNPTNYIKGAIDSGNPVLVGMEYLGGTHFVAAYGYDGNNIIISDNKKKNYQFLYQYLNSGYTVYRLCTYFK